MKNLAAILLIGSFIGANWAFAEHLTLGDSSENQRIYYELTNPNNKELHARLDISPEVQYYFSEIEIAKKDKKKRGLLNIFKGMLVPLDETNAPSLTSAVKELSEKLKLPQPDIFVAVDKDFYNAFASSFSHDRALIAVGLGMVKDMTDGELTAIIGHELGHIYHNHVSKKIAINFVNLAVFLAQRMATIWMLNTRLHNLTNGQKFGTGVSIAITTFLASAMIGAKFSQHFEKEADAVALKIARPKDLANAFRKIKKKQLKSVAEYEILFKHPDYKTLSYVSRFSANLNYWFEKNIVPGLSNLFGSHPDTQSRIDRAEAVCGCVH